jgi:hypothetical protein
VSVIERQQIADVMKEQELHSSGMLESQSAIQIGRILAVSTIITGEVHKFNDNYVINAKVVDVETGQIRVSYTEKCRGFSEIPDASSALSEKILQSGLFGKEDHKNNRRNTSWWSYTWRATLFPGLGHFYGGNYIRGSAYTLLILGATANYMARNDQVQMEPTSEERRIERGKAVAIAIFLYVFSIVDAGLYAGTDDWFLYASSQEKVTIDRTQIRSQTQRPDGIEVGFSTRF